MPITEELQKYIDQLKANDPKLVSLNLGGCEIGDSGVEALAEALSENHTLIKLGLKSNKIGVDGVRFLAAALKVNQTLTVIDLKHNNVDENGVRILLEMLKKNGALLIIDLYGNPFDAQIMSESLDVMRTILRRNYRCAARHFDTDDLSASKKRRINDDSMERKKPYQIIPGVAIAITIGKELGRGRYGRVFKGRWWKHGEVAVKIPSDSSTATMRVFKQEANILGRLGHPNVVQLYGVIGASYAMVMELIPNGTTLYRMLHNGSLFTWSLTFQIAKDIAAGLTYLHEQGIVHCDLKSGNILLDLNMRAKITDFGLSRSVETGAEKHGFGTIRWMSPEVLKGAEFKKEDDVYSFGMILWELITHARPYDSIVDSLVAAWIISGHKENIPENCTNVYPYYAGLISRCWEERSKRPIIQVVAETLKSLI